MENIRKNALSLVFIAVSFLSISQANASEEIEYIYYKEPKFISLSSGGFTKVYGEKRIKFSEQNIKTQVRFIVVPPKNAKQTIIINGENQWRK